jgi:hypothetical protein
VSGSRSGIALARSVVHVYSFVTAVRYHERGFVYYTAASGQPFSWRWGSGPAAGYTAADEHAVVGLRGGRVVWWRDELTPICSGRCSTPSVELVVDSAGAFYAYRTASSRTCFGRLSGTTPYAVSAPVYSVAGSYRSPVIHGGLTLLTSVYAWTATQRATETDTISRRTRLPVKTSVRVVARASGALVFSFSSIYGNPRSTPRAPVIKRCG